MLFNSELFDFAVERALRHKEFGCGLLAATVVAAQGSHYLVAHDIGLRELAWLIEYLLALGKILDNVLRLARE